MMSGCDQHLVIVKKSRPAPCREHGYRPVSHHPEASGSGVDQSVPVHLDARGAGGTVRARGVRRAREPPGEGAPRDGQGPRPAGDRRGAREGGNEPTSRAGGGAGPFVLTESLAINTYLGDKYLSHANSNSTEEEQGGHRGTHEASCPPLTMPKCGSLERARYDEALSCILSEIDASLWCHRKHTDLGRIFGSIPAVTAPSASAFHRANKFLAARCRPYLLGSSFTPADIAYAHCLDWAVAEGWHAGPDWPGEALTPYLERCRGRPAYRRARRIRAEGQVPPHAAKL